MSIRLDFEIELKSDYHVGAGHGLGSEVDSALLRDPDRIPVIRGTVLAGLLRDALRGLLSLGPLQGHRRCKASGLTSGREYCGQFGDSGPACPVCTIFGTPSGPKSWRFSSARPAGLAAPQDPLRTSWHAGRTGAQVVRRSRVSPRTRRTEQNKLFSQEDCDGRLRFEFTAECLRDNAGAWQEAMWLYAAARFLRNLGADKRRGHGECTLRLKDEQVAETLLDRLEETLAGRSKAVADDSKTEEIKRLALSGNRDQHTYRLRVLLRTDEPVLIARRAEAGNQFESQEWIPGSAMRGALAWRVAQSAGERMEDHNSPEYRNLVDLFYSGAVRFGPLYPVQVSTQNREMGYPTIPAPRDLVECEIHPGYSNKLDKGHGVWSLTDTGAPPESCPECEKINRDSRTRLEAVTKFLPLNRAGLTTHFRPHRRVEMHVRINPENGRVRRGDLFGYVAIEPGQFFVGEITCATKDTWNVLQSMSGLGSTGEIQELRLGKAAGRGHGKVSVLFQETEKAPWYGPDLSQRVRALEEIVMTLLSDTIVVDPWGRFVRGFEQGWIKRELGLPEEAVVKVEAGRCFSGVRPVDTFNAKLGLPRSRDWAIAAGSTARLTVSGMMIDKLRRHLGRAEERGVGIRREEGFGRVAFNHPIYEDLAKWRETALDLGALALGRDARSQELMARDEFERWWRAVLDAEVRPGTYAYGPFEAAARLVHASSASAAAVDALQHLGEQDQLLPEPLGGREKKAFYKEEKGFQGIRQLCELLNHLEEKLHRLSISEEMRADLRGLALRMLADQVAGPARLSAQERR